MIRAITILTANFSDWETALINSAGRSYYGFDTRFAAPGGQPVTSSGGLIVTPHLATEEIRLDETDVLIVCGGTIWKSAHAPDITDLVAAAHKRNCIIAGICDGTRVLAQAGVLDYVRHTSNSKENLSELGYGGAASYQDVPYAVADGRVITAPGSAPASFMAEILRAAGKWDDNLQAYLSMLAAEHRLAV